MLTGERGRFCLYVWKKQETGIFFCSPSRAPAHHLSSLLYRARFLLLHSFETQMSTDDPVHILDLWHMQLLQTALDEEEMECKNNANNSLVDSKQSSSSALNNNNNQTKESVVVAITFTRDNTPLHPKQVITVRLTTRSSHSGPSVVAAAAAAGHPTAQ